MTWAAHRWISRDVGFVGSRPCCGRRPSPKPSRIRPFLRPPPLPVAAPDPTPPTAGQRVVPLTPPLPRRLFLLRRPPSGPASPAGMLGAAADEVRQPRWKPHAHTSARLNHSTVSFFDEPKPETAASRWNWVRLDASKVVKVLSRDSKALKLAFQHWIEAPRWRPHAHTSARAPLGREAHCKFDYFKLSLQCYASCKLILQILKKGKTRWFI